MKTYILDSINRFKRFSENLDVATTLSNKTWVVFNDSGERELYIFQPDGSVIITKNGIGIVGQWQWISANQSLIIQRDGSVIMLHPEYIDNIILALNLDGTRETAFLIEDSNRESFAPKTLSQLEGYFRNKEQKLIEEAEEQRKRLAEELRKKREHERAEEERRLRRQAKERAERIRQDKMLKQLEEQNRKNEEIEYQKRRAEDRKKELFPSWFLWVKVVVISIGVILMIWLAFVVPLGSDTGKTIMVLIILYLPLTIAICNGICEKLFRGIAEKQRLKNIEKWKKDYPDDPINKYL